MSLLFRPNLRIACCWAIALGVLLGCKRPLVIPPSKNAYLSAYEAFTEKVQDHCDRIPPSDLKYYSKTYLKFSRDWYNYYYDQLSGEEKLTIWKWRMRYLTCLSKSQIKKRFKDAYIKLEDRLLELPDET